MHFNNRGGVKILITGVWLQREAVTHSLFLTHFSCPTCILQRQNRTKITSTANCTLRCACLQDEEDRVGEHKAHLLSITLVLVLLYPREPRSQERECSDTVCLSLEGGTPLHGVGSGGQAYPSETLSWTIFSMPALPTETYITLMCGWSCARVDHCQFLI